MPVNPDSIKSKLFKNNLRNSVNPMAYSYDPYFSSNMYAIAGLPFTLMSRDGKYLSANAKWEEVKWTTTANQSAQKFHVKVLPATSGIPYLLYSYKTKTPIGVGHYTANPDEKILLVHNDESGDLYNASWDFIPSPTRPGYFAIESQSYIGQGSSGSWWDIFYHVVEVKDNELVRYGQNTQKPQQEFIIKPDAKFTLKSIDYINPYNAKVTELDTIAITRSYSNRESRTIGYDFVFDSTFKVSSNYIEQKSIAFDVNQSSKLFRRPNVTNGNIDLVIDLSKQPDSYYRSSQTIDDYIRSGLYPTRIEPKTKMYATYYFKQFKVEVDYVATITYNGKEAKILGRWDGIIIVDEIFDADFEPVSLVTNRSLGKKRINLRDVSKSSPITF